MIYKDIDASYQKALVEDFLKFNILPSSSGLFDDNGDLI